MAEVNANSLPAKTDLGTNDSAIVVDQTTNAGALVDLDVLADKVLDRLTSKTFANQVGGSSAATFPAQLSTLNSNLTTSPFIRTSYNDANEVLNGVGYVGSAGTNCPEGYGYTYILALRNYNDVFQIAHSYRSQNNIYFRSSNNGTWSKWYKIGGSLTSS